MIKSLGEQHLDLFRTKAKYLMGAGTHFDVGKILLHLKAYKRVYQKLMHISPVTLIVTGKDSSILC